MSESKKNVEGIINRIINKEGEEIKVDWEKFYDAYQSAKKVDDSQAQAFLEKERRDYDDLCSILLYHGILNFTPQKDPTNPEEKNYEIVCGHDNENRDPRQFVGGHSLILYFTRKEDALAYKKIVAKKAEKNLYPIQVREVIIEEFDV